MAFAEKRQRGSVITKLPVKFIVRPADYFITKEIEKESRKYQDKYVPFNIHEDHMNEVFSGTIGELNNMEAVIWTEANLMPNTRVEINFNLPGVVNTIEAVGIVKWLRKEEITVKTSTADLIDESFKGLTVSKGAAKETTIKVPRGIAINFEYMSIDDNQLLCNYIKTAPQKAAETIESRINALLMAPADRHSAVVKPGLSVTGISSFDITEMDLEMRDLEEMVAPLALA